MPRSRASARKIGPTYERSIADGLKEKLGNEYIDRRPKRGRNDTGDIGGVKIDGHRLVIECKEVGHESCNKCQRVYGLKLPEWVKEAKQEAINDGALAGFVVHKRKGTTDPMKQWVTCTVAELVALITKNPVEAEK